MTHFVLPGGHTTVSYCHIARCVCRRAERLAVHLSHNEPRYRNQYKPTF
jgi:cob(I)alamin adenosyltransferase